MKARDIKEIGKLPKAMTIMTNIYGVMYTMAWGYSAFGTYMKWKIYVVYVTLISIGTVPLLINLAIWNRLFRV